MKYAILDFEKEFPNDDACLQRIFESKNYKCCGQFNRVKGRTAYACTCGKQVYPLKGTIFENSQTSLKLWFYAIYLFSQSKHGITAAELQRQLGVTYKCAWRIGHQVRKLMKQHPHKRRGVFEIDETFIGGRKSKKMPVLGILDRFGYVQAHVVPDVRKMTLDYYIWNYIKRGSTVITDEAMYYRNLGYLYDHYAVKHSDKEWVRGQVYTNSIEGFWSHVKRQWRNHISCSPQHLQKYIDECVYRYNHRNSDRHLFHHLLEEI